MSKRTTKSKGRKRPKEVINSFFAWRKVYLEHLFERPEVKKNMRLFGLAYYLSDHFDWEDYSCWPSRETIAEAIGVEVRTVSTLTNKLAEMGFLRVKRRGPDMSALYIGRLPDDAQSNAHQEAQSNARHGSSPDGLKRNPTSLDAQLNCNQTCNGLHPNDSDERSLEREGAAQAAPHQSTDRNSVSREAAFADASGSPIGDREQDYSFADLQEIERRDEAFATGPLPPFDGQETPPLVSHDEDEHQSFADEDDEFADDDDCEGRIPYDDPSSDEGGTDLGDASSDSQAEPIAAVVEDRATFVTQKHHRWPDEFDPDAVYDEGGEPIRNDDADETDVDFEDDADEETHEGARL